jgi:hypothetical protein
MNDASRIGIPNDRKWLIVHADDFGMAHSINVATWWALEQGHVTSASVMVPCPWSAEAMGLWRQRPSADIGVHVTLTSEWPLYKWRPLSSPAKSSGLVDAYGNFHSNRHCIAGVEPDFIETEIEAQIEFVLSTGLVPSHIDCHMFSAFVTTATCACYCRAACRAHVRCILPLHYDCVCSTVRGEEPEADMRVRVNVHQIGIDVPPDIWEAAYIGILRSLGYGLNVLIVHLGYDNGELRCVTGNQRPWGAAWRQRDLDVVSGPAFKAEVRGNSIVLTNWRDLIAKHW